MNPSRPIIALALALLVPSLAAAEGPLTLDDALARASKNNLDLVLAREDARIASADATATFAGLLPRLDVRYSASKEWSGETEGFRTSTGALIPGQPATNQNSYSFSTSLTQPLFDWQAIQNSRSSSAATRAAERTFDENTLSIAFEVSRRFYEVVRAERTLAVFEGTVARTEELVKRADALYAAGRAPRSDTFTNRVNLANDRIAVEQQRSRLAQARTALGQAIGLTGPEAQALTVAAPAQIDRAERPGQPPPVADVLAIAQKRRPSLAAAQARLDAAKAGVSAAWGGYLPTVDASVTYGRAYPTFRGDYGVAGKLENTYGASAGVTATWNLFEGRRTQASVQRAESQARRAQAGLEIAGLDVARQISDAHSIATSRSVQVGLAADNLSTAQQALALARDRLDAGLATQLEVREASLNLTRAELSLVEARIDHAVAIADLARASGGPL